MARYIDEDKLIYEIDKWLDSVGTAYVGKGLSYYGELLGCIEDTPNADVQEVKHGYWIEKKQRHTKAQAEQAQHHTESVLYVVGITLLLLLDNILNYINIVQTVESKWIRR